MISAPTDDPWKNATGHSAIEKVLGVRGEHLEGREGLPEAFANAIKRGECNKMAKVELKQTLTHVRDLVPDSLMWAQEEWDKSASIGEMRDLLKSAGAFDEIPALVWKQVAVDIAESVLPIFEKRYPKDDRVRKCIEVTRAYISGNATKDALDQANRKPLPQPPIQGGK